MDIVLCTLPASSTVTYERVIELIDEQYQGREAEERKQLARWFFGLLPADIPVGDGD